MRWEAVAVFIMTTILSNRDIYTSVVCGIVPQATDRL